MRCGEKCFYVKIEKDNEIETLPVFARSTAEARKTVRSKYGRKTAIHSVRPKRIDS